MGARTAGRAHAVINPDFSQKGSLGLLVEKYDKCWDIVNSYLSVIEGEWWNANEYCAMA